MERLDGKELDGREIRVSKAMHGRPDGAAGPPRRRDRYFNCDGDSPSYH